MDFNPTPEKDLKCTALQCFVKNVLSNSKA